MVTPKKVFLVLVVLLVFVGIFGIIFRRPIMSKIDSIKMGNATPPPPPKEIIVNNKPRVIYPQDFTIVLVGDSMTDALGNSTELRADLKKYYPNNTVEVLNYGFGSTNILSVHDRLMKSTFYFREYRPVTEIDFDLILIESFGNNPLDSFPLDEGLRKQNEALDRIVNTLKETNPQATIAFFSTIAPNKENYARGQVELSQEKRIEWANIRVAFIKNHMEYARSHNIPVIDIFSDSIDKNGDGNLEYINPKDHIHPSPNGVIFISQKLADGLYNQKLLKSH